MKPATLPEHRIVVRKLPGAPYSSHSIYVGDQCIYSSLSPFAEGEVEQRIRAHLSPAALAPIPKMARGGRPTSASKAANPNKYDWRTPPEE